MRPNFSFLPDAIRKAAQIMLAADSKEKLLREKSGDQNFVTNYDVATQELLEKEIISALPDAVFLAEEGETNPAALASDAPCFLIDPIDGTTNFIHDFRFSAISVGAAMGGALVYGAVYDPYTDAMFVGERGKGAFLTQNGVTRPIAVAKGSLCDNILLFGSSPYYRAEFADKTFDMLRGFFPRVRELRCLGSAALHLCYVACGRCGGYVEYRLSPWDHAAASVILEEAGGVITQMDGSPMTLDRPCSVAAASPGIYRELMESGLFRLD